MKKLFILVLIALSLFRISDAHVDAYTNHCWNCGSTISSNYCSRCRTCGWYICRTCGACEPGCNRVKSSSSRKTNKSSTSKKDNSWVWILVIAGVVGVGIYIYKKRE